MKWLEDALEMHAENPDNIENILIAVYAIAVITTRKALEGDDNEH